VFGQYTEHALNLVFNIINAQNAREPENILSTYCAIGALGKICVSHAPNFISNWLQLLPIKGEPEEA
jgi:hypothetical protein